VAGGMAGGSADAAAALLGCARLWGLDPAEAAALAPQLGSDVAFGLLGGTALGTGRGELLEPLPSTGELHWVLVPAEFGIAAGDAYRELDRLRAEGAVPPPALDVAGLRAALVSGRTDEVAAALHNDLEPACLSLEPGLRDVLVAGREAGALAGIVSGSGPTCAFLCTDEAAAHRVADALPRAIVARGPVPGATVLAE
jgi:4-diphosphocytidyl-2-C-methyl-D-erythritol kinase